MSNPTQTPAHTQACARTWASAQDSTGWQRKGRQCLAAWVARRGFYLPVMTCGAVPSRCQARQSSSAPPSSTVFTFVPAEAGLQRGGSLLQEVGNGGQVGVEAGDAGAAGHARDAGVAPAQLRLEILVPHARRTSPAWQRHL